MAAGAIPRTSPRWVDKSPRSASRPGGPLPPSRGCAASSLRRRFGGRRPTAIWPRTALEKSYGARRVVNGVSLYVRRGEAVGLLGPNGAGKTTVFYMITGLIKRRPRPDRARRLRRHAPADVPAGAARHRLSAAGSLDFSRPQCRGQHPRGARSGRAGPAPARRRSQCAARGVRDHRACARRPRSRCPAASGGGSRSPARWRAGRTTCCSTSRSPASIRSRWAKSRGWCGS